MLSPLSLVEMRFGSESIRASAKPNILNFECTRIWEKRNNVIPHGEVHNVHQGVARHQQVQPLPELKEQEWPCLACFQKHLFAIMLWWMYWISCHILLDSRAILSESCLAMAEELLGGGSWCQVQFPLLREGCFVQGMFPPASLLKAGWPLQRVEWRSGKAAEEYRTCDCCL